MTTKVTIHPASHDIVGYRHDVKSGVTDSTFNVTGDSDPSDQYLWGNVGLFLMEKPETERRAGTIRIYTSFNMLRFRKEYRWRFTAQNGNIVFGSTEGYANKADCLDSIPTALDIIIAKLESES